MASLSSNALCTRCGVTFNLSTNFFVKCFLCISTLVAILFAILVVEPALYNRKFVSGKCNVELSIPDFNSNPDSWPSCSCGLKCRSVRPCVNITVSFEVTSDYIDDERFFSNETSGTELLMERKRSPSSESQVCSNADCFLEPAVNKKKAIEFVEKVKCLNKTGSFCCKVNIDRPRDWRVVLDLPDDANHVSLGLIVPWTFVYFFLGVLMVVESRGASQTEPNSPVSDVDGPKNPKNPKKGTNSLNPKADDDFLVAASSTLGLVESGRIERFDARGATVAFRNSLRQMKQKRAHQA